MRTARPRARLAPIGRGSGFRARHVILEAEGRPLRRVAEAPAALDRAAPGDILSPKMPGGGVRLAIPATPDVAR